MSSFKRKVVSKQTVIPTGTKYLPGSSSVFITSTGIPSLDDILGGGLPLTCSQLILAPDTHSEYGELVQKYFISQGLASGQQLCVVHDQPREFVEGCMWTPGAAASSTTVADDEEDKPHGQDSKIKIAWRYEQMKQFQTTVPSDQSGDDFCRVFDLTTRIPASVIDKACASKQLTLAHVSASEERPVRRILRQILEMLGPNETDSTVTQSPLRICVPSLGSPSWGDLEPTEICYFLYSLRAALQRHTHACASISLPSYLSDASFGGPGWIQKLGWLSDACITLSAFTADPALSASFPSYHGFVHIHALPAPLALTPPSDKFSSLRGLSSSGENNLAFKCMRKRLVFETLHLDVEGGVSERRTTPAAVSIESIVPPKHSHAHGHSHTHDSPATGSTGMATVEVQLEQVQANGMAIQSTADVPTQSTTSSIKKVKPKKKVGFISDKPDLYDF